MEQLAPHEKIFVDDEFLDDPNHGFIACHECHGGNPEEADWLMAHDGVVRDPTYPDPIAVCGDCHPDIAETSATSLHVSLSTFNTAIQIRAGRDDSVMQDMMGATKSHCGACHASCGQCHVSRPTYVGGGFLDGHKFQRKPPMREVCTACHGSRVEREYFGKNEGSAPDVHWRKRFFTCGKCHTGDEMHGDGQVYESRYAVTAKPSCEGCHADIFENGAPNAEQHRTHQDRVSCYVCHASPYKNCYSCHFALDKYGFKYFKSKESVLDFKIGKNSNPSKGNAGQYVLLRHVPITRGTYGFYAENGMAGFNASPTWRLATPHNIRRKTPQNASCNSCHGNTSLFLMLQDVRQGEVLANTKVVVAPQDVPKVVEGQIAVRGDMPSVESEGE